MCGGVATIGERIKTDWCVQYILDVADSLFSHSHFAFALVLFRFLFYFIG